MIKWLQEVQLGAWLEDAYLALRIIKVYAAIGCCLSSPNRLSRWLGTDGGDPATCQKPVFPLGTEKGTDFRQVVIETRHFDGKERRPRRREGTGSGFWFSGGYEQGVSIRNS